MTLVSVNEIQELLTKPLTDTQRIKAQMDIESCQIALEAWARRKFEPQTITNERHVNTNGYAPVWLKWGEPLGPITIRQGSPTANPVVIRNPASREAFSPSSYMGVVVYVTYTLDMSVVLEYLPLLKRVIKNAVVAGVMRPDIVRYRVTSSYSVEGLSIQYDSGDSQSASGIRDVPGTELVGLSGLRRRFIQ